MEKSRENKFNYQARNRSVNQMALRKQPDRQVKLKRKIQETLEITKRKRKLEEPENFDIVGYLLSNYGMTGKNLVHDIFSYMDETSLKGK